MAACDARGPHQDVRGAAASLWNAARGGRRGQPEAVLDRGSLACRRTATPGWAGAARRGASSRRARDVGGRTLGPRTGIPGVAEASRLATVVAEVGEPSSKRHPVAES